MGGTALSVDRCCWHVIGKSRNEPSSSGHIERLLTNLVDAAADDLTDQSRIDTRPVEEVAKRCGQQVGGVNIGKLATALRERRPDSIEDYGWLAHPTNIGHLWRRCYISVV